MWSQLALALALAVALVPAQAAGQAPVEQAPGNRCGDARSTTLPLNCPRCSVQRSRSCKDQAVVLAVAAWVWAGSQRHGACSRKPSSRGSML
jgi:hypothetical protein